MPPKRKAAPKEAQAHSESRSLRKRSHHELEPIAEPETTPSKRSRSSPRTAASTEPEAETREPEIEHHEPVENGHLPVEKLNGDASVEIEAQPKATPKRRGRPPKASLNGGTPTPKASRTPAFQTPVKVAGSNLTTPKKQAADRSARRKSVRALIESVARSGASDDEQDDYALAREIYGSSEGEGEEQDEDEDMEGEGALESTVRPETTGPDGEPTTPSKTAKRRGRPRKTRSPTPPRDLPPYEQYFYDNKPGRPKTSNNSLGSLALLTHEEYFSILQGQQDLHKGDVEYLETLHAESFPQWTFELSQGFGICLYGLGSKRALLRQFANHLHTRSQGKQRNMIVIVNGYAPTTTIREVLSTIGSAVDPEQRIPTSQPAVMVQSIASQLSSSDMTLTVVVNSIDAAPLRKPGTQAVLAQLAAHPQVNLVCSVDTPDFPLLWDIGVRSSFNFAFHDCTTFAPFTVELDVVDDVHELLGRKARRVNGREGVAFVLKSLPENAKNLFRLLIGEVLIAMEEEGGYGEDETGVEYRMVYNKAVEEFICSSEMAFRTLLKE